MFYSEQQKYWIWLSSIQGMSIHQFNQLMMEYGEAANVWDQLILARKILTPASYRHLQAARCEAYMDDLFEQIENCDACAVTQQDEAYPERLRTITEAPPTLYVRGSLSALNPEKSFAIVGSRKMTVDGSHFTFDIARNLAESGVTIISGFAAGIDSRAHEGCLEGTMPTVAVLGSSVEIIYPEENIPLAEQIIAEGGALVSEYRPGTSPSRSTFPRRNRIISGLSDGVLMVEGTVKSGAMITMNYAREQGHPVFAVPGSVYSVASEGTNRLLLEGAQVCLGAEQVLSYFGWNEAVAAKEENEQPDLDPMSLKIVEILRFEEKSFEELANIMEMDVSELNSLLTILEMQGIIRQSVGKLYRAVI